MQAADLASDFQETVKFHGHVCPGLAIGYRAAKVAMAQLQAERPEDEELVAIVENSACGVDAIQWITGCTFGKGNLHFRDYGKQAFTVFSRKQGRGVRIALKANAFDAISNSGSEENNRRQRVEMLINNPVADLFDIREVVSPPPSPARIHNSIICENCGEKVMETRIRISEGRQLCIPCAEKLAGVL